jgi:hypothetical protein
MSRGDAELLVEVLDVVLDGVWRDDEGFGHLGTGDAAGQERRDRARSRRTSRGGPSQNARPSPARGRPPPGCRPEVRAARRAASPSVADRHGDDVAAALTPVRLGADERREREHGRGDRLVGVTLASRRRSLALWVWVSRLCLSRPVRTDLLLCPCGWVMEWHHMFV